MERKEEKKPRQKETRDRLKEIWEGEGGQETVTARAYEEEDQR